MLGITDGAAARYRLLDRAGSQPRMWEFLAERGLDYDRRIIDLTMDRHITSVIPQREALLTGAMSDFPCATQDDAAFLETEFAAASPV